MKQTQSKGITIMTLINPVVVLLILASVTIYTGGNIINNAKLQTIQTNLMLVQAKCKTIGEESSFKSDESILVGSKLADSSIKSEIQNKLGIKESSQGYDKWYILNQDNLNTLGIEGIKLTQNDFYLVNYETEEVATFKGYKDSTGNTYYLLSEIQNLGLTE